MVRFPPQNSENIFQLFLISPKRCPARIMHSQKQVYLTPAIIHAKQIDVYSTMTNEIREFRFV